MSPPAKVDDERSMNATKENTAIPGGWRFMFSHPAHLLALGFGSGLSPKAPGTFGTLAALPFWFVLASLSQPWQWLVIGLCFFVGVWLCSVTSKALKTHDHGGIVWDEFVGVWVTLGFVSFGFINLLLGFLLFRFFDILKPWPISWLDKRVHGGWGIMLDDLVAGLFAGLVLLFIDNAML